MCLLLFDGACGNTKAAVALLVKFSAVQFLIESEIQKLTCVWPVASHSLSLYFLRLLFSPPRCSSFSSSSYSLGSFLFLSLSVFLSVLINCYLRLCLSISYIDSTTFSSCLAIRLPQPSSFFMALSFYQPVRLFALRRPFIIQCLSYNYCTLFWSIRVHSILFYIATVCQCILSYSVYSVLFYYVLYCSTLCVYNPICSNLFYSGLFCSIIFCSILSCSSQFFIWRALKKLSSVRSGCYYVHPQNNAMQLIQSRPIPPLYLRFYPFLRRKNTQ